MPVPHTGQLLENPGRGRLLPVPRLSNLSTDTLCASDAVRPLLTTRQARIGVLLTALMLAGYAGLFIWRSSFVVEGERVFCLFDDPMISMRYARNLAQGHGLVWNPGGERVEGYTNPLWVLYMAGLHLLPVAETKLPLLVQATGALCLVINSLLVWKLASALAPTRPAVGLAAVITTAFYYPLNYWALTGFEVAALAPLVTASAWLAMRTLRSGRFSLWPYLLALLGTALRPDAAVAYLAVWAFLVVADRPHRVRHLVLGLSLLVLGLAAQTGFRYRYFGELLPNTYYLKLTGYPLFPRMVSGAIAFWNFVAGFNPLLAVLAGVAVAYGRRPEALLAGWLVLVHSVYSIYVGGDAFEDMGGSNRYLAVIMPCFFVLLWDGLAYLVERFAQPRTDANGGLISTPNYLVIALTALAMLTLYGRPLASILVRYANRGLGAGLLGAILIPAAGFAGLAVRIRFASDRRFRVTMLLPVAAIAIHLFTSWYFGGPWDIAIAILLLVITWTAVTLQAFRQFPLFLILVLCLVSQAFWLTTVDALGFCVGLLLMLAFLNPRLRRPYLLGALAVIACEYVAWLVLLPQEWNPAALRNAFATSRILPTASLLIVRATDFLLAWNPLLLGLPLLALWGQRNRVLQLVTGAAIAQLIWTGLHGTLLYSSWGLNPSVGLAIPLFWLAFAASVERLPEFARRAALGWQALSAPGRCSIAAAALAFVLVNLNGFGETESLARAMLLTPPPLTTENAYNVRLARQLSRCCQPGAKVAVCWAGTVPYFADINAIDLLGKCDPVIARLPAHVEAGWARFTDFHPGHNKWDYAYSIGLLQPDLVVQLCKDPEEMQRLLAVNYESVQFGTDTFFVRRGSPAINFELLRPAASRAGP
jgi:hypothetical protein